MILQNSTDVKTEYFLDKNNDPAPVDVRYEKHIINPNGLVQLQNIPSPLHTVFDIRGKDGVTVIKYNKVEVISNKYDFTVDYINGILTFHNSQIGKEVQVSYTNSIGRLNISADRVFTRIDNQGNVVETLGTLLEEGRQTLSDLEVLGGATKVITEIEGYIESIKELTGNIVEGDNVNTKLVKSTDVAKSTNTTLNLTINNANNQINEMNNWVESHGDIVNLDERVDETENKLTSVGTQLADIAINVTSFWKNVFTNWSPAIQLAHDSLPSTGGIILIPQGEILELEQEINITKPNVVFLNLAGGYGLSGVKGKTPNMTMFNVDNYGFTIKAISIIGDGIVGDTTSATIIPFKINASITGDADCFLDNVLIMQCKNAGEFKGRNIRIKNNCLISNCYNGFRILGGYSDMRGIEINDVRFHSIGIGNTSVTKTSCIYIEPTANYREVKINVYADDCENVVTGAISTGNLTDCISYRARGEIFDLDNTLLTTSANERQLKIADNSISFYNIKNNSHGMKLKGIGFKIVDNQVQKATKCGIYCESVTESEIHDNSISNCGYEENQDGIYLDSNSSKNNIKDNIVKKNDSNCIIRHGIHVEGNENTFEDNTVIGIDIDNAIWIEPSKIAYGDCRSVFNKNKEYYGTGAPTTGRWRAGDKVNNLNPTITKNIQYWICVSGGIPGIWRAVGIGQGSTEERPSMTNRDIGYQFFDTTLQKVLYYDGVGYKGGM